MILEKLTYSKLFPTGSFSNERVEISGSLEPNEDIMQAYSQLHDMARELHFSKNKELYEQMGEKVTTIEPVDYDTPLIDQINSCKELKVLESYKLIVRNDETLNNAYRKKLIELSNQ